MKSKIPFEFPNQVSPRYIQPLFLRMEFGIWYSSADMRELLHQNGLAIEGGNIIRANIDIWSLLQLGEKRIKNSEERKSEFKLTKFGKQLQETYSTNQELFFELMHFLFYEPWKKNSSPQLGRFWVYSRACDILWENTPDQMDSFGLAGILQQEAQEVFRGYNPKFPERGVRAVFPWLVALTPPFLSRKSTQRVLSSSKRENCSPQLFHLALDLIYNKKQLKYGTSMAIGDEEIKDICKVCLLDEKHFWEILDRTKMIIRGVEIRRGQFSTSIALEMKPQWIDLPDYSNEIKYDNEYKGMKNE